MIDYEFIEYKINAITEAKVREINSNSVVFEQAGEVKVCECDKVILATGQKPYGAELISSLKENGFDVITIGDAIRPGKIMGAVRQGNFAGCSI